MRIFKDKSWLNKLLIKYFNKRIMYTKGIFYIQTGKVWYTCSICKEGMYKIPVVNQKPYTYKLVHSSECQLANEYEDDNVKVYGWVIEVKYTVNDKDKWYNHHNHKVYNTKGQALEALVQARTSNDKYHWRVAPLYRIEQNYYRRIAINQIIEEKNKN